MKRRGDRPAARFAAFHAEVLDHRLRVDPRLGVGRELAHGRRPLQPLGRGAQLGEDLLVGIAPSQAGAERRERLLVDAATAGCRRRALGTQLL